ncbi:MAG: hypothetical protein MJ219_04410, partial [Mycoplasmoidaceae bacterium]|nr:hypothetical protein [Mycoplasmoidaceae bacterium]
AIGYKLNPKNKIVAIGDPNHIFGKTNLESLSLDKPFVFKLSQALGKKPTANLNKLVREIAHER